VRLWWLHGACRHESKDTFFADDEFTVARAKKICSTCVVRPGCRDAELEVNRRDPSTIIGVFGGMSANERRVFIRNERSQYSQTEPPKDAA
jgi:hypothetical protein